MPPTTAESIDITVLVSCYNEASFIADTLGNVTGALQEAGCAYEVIVVDDASKDNSVAVIRNYIQQHPELRIRLKANEKNRGLGNNYVEAAFLGSGKYYRLCVGDNPEPKEELVPMFRCLGKADMIIPYHEVTGKKWSRKVITATYTFLVNLLSGYHIRYYNGLAIHLRYNVMRWPPVSYGFGFQADTITRLLDEGASYAHVTIHSIERKAGASTALSLRNVLSVSHTLLEVAIRRMRRMIYGRHWPKPVEIPIESFPRSGFRLNDLNPGKL
jgi:glycosyltransferase involved in cell wall biosynthesis